MKKELKIGVFVLIVLSIFAYFVIKTDSILDIFSKGKSYNLYARFSTVSGLFKSSPVRLAGVRIGTVQDIYLEGHKATVKLLIKDSFKISEDARAVIGSVGIVGENFVEIVYKDEFKLDKPTILKDGDNLKSITTSGLEAISEKFDSISDKMGTLLDSVNAVIAEKKSQDSLKATLDNIKDITANLKQLSGNNGKLNGVFKDIEQLGSQLKNSIKSLDRFVVDLDNSLYKKDKGMMPQLEAVAENIKAISLDLKAITGDMNDGKGTAGKLLKDDSLYKKIDDSISSVNNIISDLEQKKEDIDKTKLDYYAGIDYFTGDKQARFSFGLNLDFSNFSLITRVREDAYEGDPYFTLMAGKQLGLFSVAAGMVDSGLGAALYLHLFKRRVNVQVEASRFYRTNSPLLKTNVSFILSNHINLSVGYEDLIESGSRKFHVGLSFSN
jgi:phospholipid/cholesterol/gamma-HCH transport system substrate-binding protein